MQFIENGPDIPERLLQWHEDGRVVFFCGAGISVPARLPCFEELVERLYQELMPVRSAAQSAAIDAKQFDLAIHLLETELAGGRAKVRRVLAEQLQPSNTDSNALATHEALLTLAQNREGKLRLVTTNCDRMFEKVKALKKLTFQSFQAPQLPAPNNSWDGLVYLHGLLPEEISEEALQELVFSSGDFGSAYLVERWAARFVSELCRNFTICFVGYSINDPILRYMVDALAASRLQGEAPPEMFAFGGYSDDNKGKRINEWKTKGVTPILYDECGHHAILHKTLQEWAVCHCDVIEYKKRIVEKWAPLPLSESTQQNDFVGRMLWAISDPSGLPAKHFANLNPVPPLEWLKAFERERYDFSDLERFGVYAKSTQDRSPVNRYSLLHRPAPYQLAPQMNLVAVERQDVQWDEVMRHIAAWLVRHLDDPRLLLWCIEKGGCLHDELAHSIEWRLDELGELSKSGNVDALNSIQAKAPQAVPSTEMRVYWRLLLNKRIKTKVHSPDFFRWRKLFGQEGLTSSTRFALRELLKPCVRPRMSFDWDDLDIDEQYYIKKQKITDLFEVTLASDYVRSNLLELSENAQWKAALPELLGDATILLRDALDLMSEIGSANNQHDWSCISLPSISEHPQNNSSCAWIALIELARDAWLAMAAHSPELVRAAAEAWMYEPYPVFRRLAFFAAAQGQVIPAQQALDWLLSEGGLWLWSAETGREAMRLLVALTPRLDEAKLTELERAILSGPPRNLYKDDIDVETWIRLRLAKIYWAGATLGAEGKARLSDISEDELRKLGEDECNEFSFWSEPYCWVGAHDPRKPIVRIPRPGRRALEYLQAHPEDEDEDESQDDWDEICAQCPRVAVYVLSSLSQQGQWPIHRWRTALQKWSNKSLSRRSWCRMAPVVKAMSDNVLLQLIRNVSCWMQYVAQGDVAHEALFFELAQKIFDLDSGEGLEDDDFIFQALNSPVGGITRALLDWCRNKNIKQHEGLPENIKVIFTELCDTKQEKFRHGRIFMATDVIFLLYADKAWSHQHLLPLFDWQTSAVEAQAAWQGFLQSHRWSHDLLAAIKPAFLATSGHYDKLGHYGGHFSSLLTFVSLDNNGKYTPEELASAFLALPAEGLREASRALLRAQEAAGEQREEYWKNRVAPFWKDFWPKSIGRVQDTDAASLAQLCIAAGNEFPAAVTTLEPWLRAVPDFYNIPQRLHEAGTDRRFPEKALVFLHAVVDEQTCGSVRELRSCLDTIRQAKRSIEKEPNFMRLDEIARKHES